MNYFYKIIRTANLILLLFYIILIIYHLYKTEYYFTKEQISKNYLYLENYIDNKNAIATQNPLKKDIIGEIIDYQNNDKFILILQKVDFEVYKEFGRFFDINLDTNKYPIIDDLYFLNHLKWDEYVNEKISKDEYIKKVFLNNLNYYIIFKNNDSLIGPFNNIEYNKKRNELKISNKLQLISEKNILKIQDKIILFFLIECILYWFIYVIHFIIKNLIG